MYGLIEKLHEDRIAIMMISHDISAALQYVGHILHIESRIFLQRIGTVLFHSDLTSGRIRVIRFQTEMVLFGFFTLLIFLFFGQIEKNPDFGLTTGKMYARIY